MSKANANIVDKFKQRLALIEPRLIEGLRQRVGPPPQDEAQPARKDDAYRLFWRQADGWTDEQEQAMWAQGAKQADIITAKYPDRMKVVSSDERRDDIAKQVKFVDQMVEQRAQELQGVLERGMSHGGS